MHSSASSSNFTDNIHDPSTVMQRPTSAKTPDVTHILTSIFGEIFTKDVLTTDTIKNLAVSSDVDNDYHRRYVQRLRETQMLRENRMQDYAMLEKHVLEARAKAMAYEERENERRKKVCHDPDRLGVPSAKSYFSYCLDDTLLKDHNLLVPSDYYYRIKQPFVPMPRGESPPSHLKSTVSTRSRSQMSSFKKLPSITNSNNNSMIVRVPCIDDIEELHKAGSEEEYNRAAGYDNNYDNDDDIRSVSTTNDEDDDNHQDGTNKKNKKKKKKPFWKDVLRQEERICFKEQFKNLERRTRFLQNPRLESMRVAQLNPNPEFVIEVVPQVIAFNKYVIGKAYESSFEIRNVSKIAHQVRALPPNTQYFSLSLGQYPKGQSMIAPGLSAVYNIRFIPDSLCSYEDKLSIECSNGYKISLPIIAKRESPKLTIGNMLDCGYALVGQIKVCRYLIQNEGGDGRFVILSKASWPATNFKTNVSASSLSLYPFEIQPSIFELRKGDVFALEVVFKPPDTKRYSQEIVISCDNCTTIDMKLVGSGELALVEYMSSADETNHSSNEQQQQNTENHIAIDDYKDISSSKIIRFQSLNPNVYTTKRFAIKNTTSSPIDYSWIIYKPIFEENLENQMRMRNVNYAIEKDSYTFSIAPKQGTLDKNEVKYFEAMFSPLKVGAYNNVAHLVLNGIPEINTQMLLDTTDSIHKSSLGKDDLNTVDFVATVIELRGTCEPFEFTLDPPAIYVPGQIYMHSTVRKAFRLINMSICPITFNWKQIVDGPHVIQVEPSYGEIAPKSYALMDVLITSSKPGKIASDIGCNVEHADEPIYLHVEADVKGPEAIIQQAAVDFGLVRLGTSAKSFVTLTNTSNLPISFTVAASESPELFKFEPHGTLLPLESKNVDILFTPVEEILFNKLFEINIENGASLKFNCYAHVQRPKASLVESEIALMDVYLNVEKQVTVKLCNHSALTAEFNWSKAEGDDANHCSLFMEPNSGLIEPKSTVECTFKFNSMKLGGINDLRIPCYIKEMSVPLFLSVNAVVKGVAINYYFSERYYENVDHLKTKQFESFQSALIDFGDVKIEEAEVEKYFYIRNESAIRTTLTFKIKNFQAVEAERLNKQNFSDPMKMVTKISQLYLPKDNQNGVAFVPEFATLVLEPFGTVCMRIYALIQMWGRYQDSLMIQVDGLWYEHHIPIRAIVVDLPIKLYTGKVTEGENEKVSMLRFGSLIQGCASVTRKIKILNMSWLPIEIDWKIYLVNAGDPQLIDMNVIYEDPEEIESNEQQQQHQQKQHIADSTTNHSDQRRATPLSGDDNSDDDEDGDEQLNKHRKMNNNNKTVTSSVATSNEYSDTYIYIERIPFIHLKLTSHYGQEVNKENPVFLLNKTKMFLKPRDRNSIEVTFNSNVNKCQSYEAIFVGYFNLAAKYQRGEGFERAVGFDREPLLFKATGKLESPHLLVENDEDLKFEIAFGELIKPNELKMLEEKTYVNDFGVMNTSLTPISYDLSVNEPFEIACAASVVVSRKKNKEIKPREKHTIEVSFKLSKKMFKHLSNMMLIRPSPLAQDQNKYCLINEEIKINYSNDLHQIVPISARIFVPEIKLDKHLIDFGQTLVGQKRCNQFVIRNPSKSSLIWNLDIEQDRLELFETDLTYGYLEASKVYVSKSEQVVNVFFTAKHNEPYRAKIVLNIEPNGLMMEPLSIELRGSGTYDQKAEAFFNI